MKKDIDVSTLTDEEICALYSYKIPLLSADGSCRCVVDTRIMCEAHIIQGAVRSISIGQL